MVWGLYPSKGRETAELAFGSMIQVTTDQERPAMAEQFNDTKFGNGDTEIDPFLGGLVTACVRYGSETLVPSHAAIAKNVWLRGRVASVKKQANGTVEIKLLQTDNELGPSSRMFLYSSKGDRVGHLATAMAPRFNTIAEDLTKALTLVVPSNRPILGAGKVKLNIRPEGLKLGTEIVTLGDINLADHMMTRVSGVTIVQQPLDGGRCAINNNNLATTTGGCWDVDSGLEWYTLANRKSPEPINPFLTIYATGADIRREGVPGDAIVSFSAPADRALTPIGRVLENRDIEKTRDTAIDACLDLTANGHSDWRLPTSDEFRSLYRDHPEARFALGVQLTEQSYQIPYSGMAWTADGYGVQSLRARSTLYDLITGLPILLETPACKVTKAFRATENQGGNGFDILITDCKAESYPFGEQGNKLYSEALGRGLARGAGASFPAVICVRDRK